MTIKLTNDRSSSDNTVLIQQSAKTVSQIFGFGYDLLSVFCFLILNTFLGSARCPNKTAGQMNVKNTIFTVQVIKHSY